MPSPSQSLDEEDKLILFMATLGWTYGKYDDQCFHIFDSSGGNTMTRESAKYIYAHVAHLVESCLPAKKPRTTYAEASKNVILMEIAHFNSGYSQAIDDMRQTAKSLGIDLTLNNNKENQ